MISAAVKCLVPHNSKIISSFDGFFNYLIFSGCTAFDSDDPIPVDRAGDLKLEDAPSTILPQLATVPIHYTDLEGVEHDSITLFADSATTAG